MYSVKNDCIVSIFSKKYYFEENIFYMLVYIKKIGNKKIILFLLIPIIYVQNKL